jgi:MinD-like ATPase involved in chromosome partitioning or flagellar assembly
VGKTTFSLNFALSLAKNRRTVLLDLDSGTSSLRSCLDVPVSRDLHSALIKGVPLSECLTRLPAAMDPDGVFANFSFIASPRHFVSDIVNMDSRARERLMQAINQLPADYVVIDMKAGLDSNVLDFLPWTNSGILLFTPKMKTATRTAAEMAKAVLLRSLRLFLDSAAGREVLLARGGPGADSALRRMTSKLDDLENGDLATVDDYLLEVESPGHPLGQALHRFLSLYRVYFVLNQFNSVDESFDTVVKPFISYLYNHLSPRVAVHNLGWLVYDERIRESSESGVPFLVRRHYLKKRPARSEPGLDEKLREMFGIAARRPAMNQPAPTLERKMDGQIELLRKIYICNQGSDPETNLDFIVERAKIYAASSAHEFGVRRFLSSEEFLRRFARLLPERSDAAPVPETRD